MKTAVALRYVYFEDVGTLDAVLVEQGYQLHYLDPTLDGIDNAAIQHVDLLIVLGGPIGAYDEQIYPFLADTLTLLQQRLDSGKPLLGICLGAQLIARALGARVSPLNVKEIGFAPLTLTAAGETSVLSGLKNIPVLHWHGDHFNLPANAVHLASTTVCPYQAFSIGPNVLGLQFHLEADVNRIEQWLIGHACELGQAGIDPCTLRTAASKLGNRLTLASHVVFTAWLQQLEEKTPLC